MHTGFATQPAEGMIALDVNTGRLDARHFPFGDFHQFRSKTMLLTPTQVHAQNHLCPILGFGAARPRLNIDKAIGSIMLSRKHPLKFQFFDHHQGRIQIGIHRSQQFLILLAERKFQHFVSVSQTGTQLVHRFDDGFQSRSFPAQFLGFFRLTPDTGVFQFALNFF